MASITWIQLSDWHQQGKDFDRQVVRDALMKDIRDRAKIDHTLTQIDLVIFSGDAASSGKKDEYQAAREHLFDPVLKATGLSAEHLFIVPGNHDLDRAAFEMLPAALQNVLNEEECKKWLTDDKKRLRLLEPFEAFSEFVGDYTHQDSPGYASIRSFNLGGKKILLLGLNSAWMCGRNKDGKGEVNDYGFTLLGEHQIHDALKRVDEADVCLVVLHHPFNWLAEFDRQRVEDRLGKAAHFILCGHQHDPQVKIIQGTGGDCISIPAGASYERRTATNPRYTNAYNFVHLDFSSGKGIVYLRRWSDKRNEWIEDIESCKNGRYSFELPKNLRVGKPDGPIPVTGPAVEISLHVSSEAEPRMNLDKELDAFKKIATGENTQTRLILVTGAGGMGKSYLLSLYQRVADENNLDVIFFGLGQQISVHNCLNQIVARFGCEHFHFYGEFLINHPYKPLPPAEEKGWQSNLTREFFRDVSQCPNKSPIVVFFDQYEKADPIFKNWLTQIFLPSISDRYPIITVVSGREEIDPLPFVKGCRHFPLIGVNVDWYQQYAKDCNVELDSKDINLLHEVLKGRPKEFVEYVKTKKGAVQ